MCFFFLFSSLFFHQTYAGVRKKNKMPKEKKHWLSVPDYLTDKWHTELIVLSAVIILFMFYQTMIEYTASSHHESLTFPGTWPLFSGKEGARIFNRNVQARPHYYQQSLRSMISTERILAFGFQWPDSVTRLLPPNSCKRALRCFQSFGECAWLASIMLFKIMVWDVHPFIYLHQTTEKEKVLLPPRNNCEEIASSTQSSLQVQRASVARMTPTVNSSDLGILSFFFFFGFQPKATRVGDEKHRKKSTWPK